MYNNLLFNHAYHNDSDRIEDLSFLVTGGAGFVGSNIAEYLLRAGAKKVRVLDNLSNGYYSNIEKFLELPNFEFVEGDIRDIETCKKALEGIDYLSHQAALGSVPRSVSDPATSNEVNIGGHLNMMIAAKESSTLKRMVYAASSSSFGDSTKLPKVEGEEGKPLSPYAVTKWVNELYADVFSKVYGFHCIGLRYFNIFGPKQNPLNPYAAVIPLFMKSAVAGESPRINGDGTYSRDFTFIENAVQANVRALLHTPDLANHEVCNIAVGDRTTVLDLWTAVRNAAEVDIDPDFGPVRPGDVPHSLASIEKAQNLFGYDPKFRIDEGIEITFEWFKEAYKSF
ncbi:SDR family oxidoreductase [Phaeocystidibacter luteus]|uniref:SDR family oxidoreductase n=1 Tax=Phaeocystidibacter luteus TaxID=911197 RepID=A0A6N6RKA7_9FLAO|nr:SDR family oxidoreductase [Phaeocystidibacter luteus]KAB2814338.1 SDR family oxidoreductase [Phaeocystidibacter luteus]